MAQPNFNDFLVQVTPHTAKIFVRKRLHDILAVWGLRYSNPEYDPHSDPELVAICNRFTDELEEYLKRKL